MRISTRKALAVGALAIAGIGGSLATATAAQAHNANYNCTTWWVSNGATLNCVGAGAGDSAQLRLTCIRITDDTLQTKYSGWIGNSSVSLYCSSGYEPYSKAYREAYADGHISGWIS
ncbi:MAG TPA: hypothetical protein VF163_11480 [Micromonosporaceae bacterium]